MITEKENLIYRSIWNIMIDLLEKYKGKKFTVVLSSDLDRYNKGEIENLFDRRFLIVDYSSAFVAINALYSYYKKYLNYNTSLYSKLAEFEIIDRPYKPKRNGFDVVEMSKRKDFDLDKEEIEQIRVSASNMLQHYPNTPVQLYFADKNDKVLDLDSYCGSEKLNLPSYMGIEDLRQLRKDMVFVAKAYKESTGKSIFKKNHLEVYRQLEEEDSLTMTHDSNKVYAFKLRWRDMHKNAVSRDASIISPAFNYSYITTNGDLVLNEDDYLFTGYAKDDTTFDYLFKYLDERGSGALLGDISLSINELGSLRNYILIDIVQHTALSFTINSSLNIIESFLDLTTGKYGSLKQLNNLMVKLSLISSYIV